MDLGLVIIISVLLFMLGSVLASFCGVLAYRIPLKLSIVKPDSFCPSCKKPIKWYDNIPIISYLVLGGKCRYCKAKIGFDSFLHELLGGVLYVVTFLMLKDTWIDLLFVLPMVSILLLIAFEDFSTHEVYLPFLIAFGVLAAGYILYKSLTKMQAPWDELIGLGIGLVFFLLIMLVGKLILKKDALGGADIIFIAIAGFLVGYKKLLILLLVASLMGTIIECIKMAVKKQKGEVAFCPYLVLGTYVALVFGDVIIDAVLRLIYAII